MKSLATHLFYFLDIKLCIDLVDIEGCEIVFRSFGAADKGKAAVAFL